MRIVFINLITALLSLFVAGFGVWTYNQSVYHDKIRKELMEKQETSFTKLKEASLLNDRSILLKGIIDSDNTFMSTRNKKVVIERYKEETKPKDSNRDWKTLKDKSIFKVIPFKLKDKDGNSVLIDTLDPDKSFLGDPDSKIEEVNSEMLQKNYWEFEPNQEIYILGELDNKAGQFVISNPNLKKSVFSLFWDKAPFIITKYKPSELALKAQKSASSIFYSAIALLGISVFLVFSSIRNIMRALSREPE